MDITGSDTNAATARGRISRARRHNTRAVRPNQARWLSFHGTLDFNHIINRNSFGNAHDQFQTRVHSFKDRIRSERRRNKDSRGGRSGLLNSFSNGVEDWNLLLEELA